MTLADRIKEIRRNKGLKQADFGELFGVKETTVTSWETGVRNPSETVMLAICQKFNVNEDWLRNGTGETFIPLTRDEQIEEFMGDVLRDEEGDFRRRLISVLAQLTSDEWDILEEKLNEIVGNKKEG